mgnify:CR=1 FL=1
MISENFYEGDEISQSDEISQGDEISQSNRNYQGDEISQGDGTSQEDTSYSGDSISQKISKAPELEIANTIDKISTSIQDGAVKAYDNLPEAKTKSKWHWAQITFLFILKIIISIIAFKLSWSCNENASSYFLKIFYTFVQYPPYCLLLNYDKIYFTWWSHQYGINS